MSSSAVWQFIAGIGLFLYAMHLIEDALKILGGRTFKVFLKKQTENTFKAILAGIVVTVLLQSSSLVSLMVLAFVGAGTIKMKNALAVILGCNIGTTLFNWLVATAGFKLNIESISYPIIGLSILTMFLFEKRNRIYLTASLFLGIGFLFMSLDFMKSSTGTVLEIFDISSYGDAPIIVYVLAGFFITSIIQSSSAIMAVTLSALNSNQITLMAGAALIIGSEAGTSIKIILGAVNGTAAKKSVAYGNFYFNLAITVLAILFIKSILILITDSIGIQDPLIALVCFQTFINTSGVLLFAPFLNRYSAFLIRTIVENGKEKVTLYINNESLKESETALDALKLEAADFISLCMWYNARAFRLNIVELKSDTAFANLSRRQNFVNLQPSDQYNYLKELEHEVLVFYNSLKTTSLTRETIQEFDQLLESTRNAMYSSKSMKDIIHNRTDLNESSHDEKYAIYLTFRDRLIAFYLRLVAAGRLCDPNALFGELVAEMKAIEQIYIEMSELMFRIDNADISGVNITSLLNMNREIYTSNKHLIYALKCLRLDSHRSEEFNSIPFYLKA